MKSTRSNKGGYTAGYVNGSIRQRFAQRSCSFKSVGRNQGRPNKKIAELAFLHVAGCKQKAGNFYIFAAPKMSQNTP